MWGRPCASSPKLSRGMWSGRNSVGRGVSRLRWTAKGGASGEGVQGGGGGCDRVEARKSGGRHERMAGGGGPARRLVRRPVRRRLGEGGRLGGGGSLGEGGRKRRKGVEGGSVAVRGVYRRRGVGSGLVFVARCSRGILPRSGGRTGRGQPVARCALKVPAFRRVASLGATRNRQTPSFIRGIGSRLR